MTSFTDRDDDGEIGLSVRADVAVDDAALVPLRAYARGHATGEPHHFAGAFLPSARVEGLRDGEFVSWSLDEYVALFDGSPAPDEATRTREIVHLELTGDTGAATMILRHGAFTFTDVFLLVRLDGEWRCASKVFERRAT